MPGSIAVADHMAAKLITFQRTGDIVTAGHTLIENRLSSAPMEDDHGNLLGILSERDCARGELHAEYYGETEGRSANSWPGPSKPLMPAPASWKSPNAS